MIVDGGGRDGGRSRWAEAEGKRWRREAVGEGRG